MSFQEQPMQQQQQQPMQQQQQQQPMQQQQQPVQVYPTTVTYQSPPDPHSNGSFGSVFVVLAIIIVISSVACCLGRLCSRRSHGHKGNNNQKHVKPQKQQNHYQNSRPKEVDIEFGFDKKIAASKPMNNGHNGHGAMPVRGVHMKQPLAHGADMKSFEIKLGPPQGKYRPGT